MSLSNEKDETLDLGSKTYRNHPNEVRENVSTFLRKQIEGRASNDLSLLQISKISGISKSALYRMKHEILQEYHSVGHGPVKCPPQARAPAAGSCLLLGQARVPPQYSMVSVFFITCSLFLSQSAVPLAPGDGQARIPQ